MLIAKTKILFLFLTVFLLSGILGFGLFWARAETPSIFDYYYKDDSGIIDDLNGQIDEKKEEIEKIKEKTARYQERIVENRDAVVSLENQIKELENRIAKSELEIQRIQLQVEQVKLEKQQVEHQIQIKEDEIKVHKERLSLMIQKMRRNDARDYLEILLLNKSFSDFFNQLEFLELLEKDVADEAQKLKASKLILEANKEALEAKNQNLNVLEIDVEREKMLLESEKEAKRILIEETERSEEKFQLLLTQLAQEQEKINKEIESIEEEVQRKIAEMRFNFTWDPDHAQFIWPVFNQGITVYFHDPSYPFRRLVGEHSGIDLRTLIDGKPSNGVPVRSAAPGLVIKVIRGGKYVGNAVYIAHSQEYMTIYLHLSQVNVQEDDVVEAGDMIGLSGGMPGTEGAGLSSGPHLHFEVRKNGIPVDPLQYLP